MMQARSFHSRHKASNKVLQLFCCVAAAAAPARLPAILFSPSPSLCLPFFLEFLLLLLPRPVHAYFLLLLFPLKAIALFTCNAMEGFFLAIAVVAVVAAAASAACLERAKVVKMLTLFFCCCCRRCCCCCCCCVEKLATNFASCLEKMKWSEKML